MYSCSILRRPPEEMAHPRLNTVALERLRDDMGKLRILSKLGDTTLQWDPSAAAVGDPEAEEAVWEAERIFRQERAAGGTAFKVSPGKPSERIDTFDPQAEQIVVVPRVAGG